MIRRLPAHRLAGGESAQGGHNTVERANGQIAALPSTAEIMMQAGEVFVMATPGGGGYDKA